MLVGAIRQRKLNGHRERVVVVEAASPFQTAKRNPTWCDIGNFEAFGRARSSGLSLDYSMVGEFHSHPNRSVNISEADIRYGRQRASEIEDCGYNMLNEHWLELVISVKKRRYKRAQKVGWKWTRRNKQLECRVMLTPYDGYIIRLGGFWIDLKVKSNGKTKAELGFPKSFNAYKLT